MTNTITGQSIAQLSARIQSGTLGCVTLVEATLDAIRAHPDQTIFTRLSAERALMEARASAERIRQGRSLGILEGIPLAWKDLFDLEGEVTTAGSVVLADQPAAKQDAAVVAALTAAGMVSVGRVNMSEFAFSGLGINPHYGTPINPRSTDGHRLPGGSSSGSAVAVANGLVPVAIGTDTGGSVRIPAAFNGLVGYKATRGRYPMDGVFPLASSLDSLGPLCHTVQDAVWIDAAMRGLTASPVRRVGLSDLSLVVPQTVFFDDAEDEVVAAFEAAVRRLESAGAKIRRQAFPVFHEMFELMAKYGSLVTAEAFALHQERLAGPEAARMDHRVVARTRLGEKTTASDYIAHLAARRRMITEFAGMLKPSEMLVSPTLPHVAPLVEPLLTDDRAFFAINGKTLRNTAIGNFFGWCGISIPCGAGKAGMPVGLLLSGLPDSDDALLAAALSAEDIVRGRD